MEEEQRRAQNRSTRGEREKGEKGFGSKSLPHRRSRVVVSISRCMGVTRAREKEQEGRELRRSLKAATIVLYSGGMEGVWVAAGREGEKEGGAARAWQKGRPHGASGGNSSEM